MQRRPVKKCFHSESQYFQEDGEFTFKRSGLRQNLGIDRSSNALLSSDLVRQGGLGLCSRQVLAEAIEAVGRECGAGATDWFVASALPRGGQAIARN